MGHSFNLCATLSESMVYLVPLLEAFHSSHGIDYPLLAGIEGMAFAAYFYS